MHKPFRILILFVLHLLPGIAGATPLSGSVHIFDPLGNDSCEYPGACDPLTGDYDETAGSLS